MVSLGREVPLGSGPVDNLFLDTNAIITFVECKRYSDARVKREVYPQALNYASDLQSHLIHYEGDEFLEQLFSIVGQGQGSDFGTLDDVIEALSNDPVIVGKNKTEWRRQFVKRLESNIKAGICRVVILCAPAPNTQFAYRAVRNLMQLMSFSEQTNSKYDLILMDLREEFDNYISRIIWRRYASLPQIPLVAEYSRDQSAGIEKMKLREEKLSEEQRLALDDLFVELAEHKIQATENTQGYSLKWEESNKSLFTQVNIKEKGWVILRHQIRSPDPLFQHILDGKPIGVLEGLMFEKRKKKSSLQGGSMFEIEITPEPPCQADQLSRAIVGIAAANK